LKAARLRAFLAGLFAFWLAVSAAASAPISYRLRPVLKDGALQAIAVTMGFAADPSGRTEIDLPDHHVGQSGLWKAMHDIAVEGPQAQLLRTGNPAVMIVRSAPRAAISLHYNLMQDRKGEPGLDEASYYRPVIQPGYFHLLGWMALAKPAGDDQRPATFRIEDLPRGWRFASTLEHTPLTVNDVQMSVSVGGDYRIVTAGSVRVALRGQWDFRDADIAARVARIAGTERNFWGDPASPYLVTILPLKKQGLAGSTGGEGLSGGYAMFLTRNSDDIHIDYGFAHERMHGWIPFQLGTVSDQSSQWLTEGFTDYFARRILLRSRAWQPQTEIAEWNAVLHDYDVSPVREATNARIANAFFSDPDIQQLPYQRGALMAIYWNWRLRALGFGGGMDAIIREMRQRARIDRAKSPVDNLVAALKAQGLDARGDIDRFIVKGQSIWLPADAFAPCGRIVTADIAAFSNGFDAEATGAADDVVTGVDPHSAAYAAGLRDGMKLIARLSPYSRDSRLMRVFRVLDRGKQRIISYLPAAKTRVRVQTLVVADPAACVKALGG
jgi:predicted metalloprotease with PDZ domain